MTPYFQTDLLSLYLADCMEMLPHIPDKHYGLSIVDPPYGDQCDLRGGSSRHGSHGWSKVFARVDEWNKIPPEEYFDELKRVSVNQIIWGANYFSSSLRPSMGWIFWDKVQREFSLAHGELAWTSFDRAIQVFTYARGNESGFAPRLSIEQKAFANIHPTQKPVALYRWLLTNYAKPGDTILDTHAGSCSLAIACHDLGFHLTAFEIDPEYLEAAVNRIKNYLKQPKLFGPPKREIVQESFL